MSVMGRLGLVALSTMILLTIASNASAEKGWLYVEASIDPATAAETNGIQHAVAFVYDSVGKKVSSGKSAGGWLPGVRIPLAPGDYWVGIGTDEIRENLHRYTVDAGKATLVRTGWISVATLPMAEQPKRGCNPWTATLRAYLKVEGKLRQVIANDNRLTDEFGAIQLHPGNYWIKFNGFMLEVEVKPGQDYRLPTGFYGPTRSAEEYLLANPEDDPRKKGIPICADGAVNVLARKYHSFEKVSMDDGRALDARTEPVTVEPNGTYGFSVMKADTTHGTKTAASGDGEAISPKQCKRLSEWGKNKGEFDDLNMFGDPL